VYSRTVDDCKMMAFCKETLYQIHFDLYNGMHVHACVWEFKFCKVSKLTD